MARFFREGERINGVPGAPLSSADDIASDDFWDTGVSDTTLAFLLRGGGISM
jgi:hypothetical protein